MKLKWGLGRVPLLQVRLRGLGRSEGAALCDAAACKAEPEDGDPTRRQQQEVSRTRNSPGDCFSPANGTWREPRRCNRHCPTRG